MIQARSAVLGVVAVLAIALTVNGGMSLFTGDTFDGEFDNTGVIDDRVQLAPSSLLLDGSDLDGWSVESNLNSENIIAPVSSSSHAYYGDRYIDMVSGNVNNGYTGDVGLQRSIDLTDVETLHFAAWYPHGYPDDTQTQGFFVQVDGNKVFEHKNNEVTNGSLFRGWKLHEVNVSAYTGQHMVTIGTFDLADNSVTYCRNIAADNCGRDNSHFGIDYVHTGQYTPSGAYTTPTVETGNLTRIANITIEDVSLPSGTDIEMEVLDGNGTVLDTVETVTEGTSTYGVNAETEQTAVRVVMESDGTATPSFSGLEVDNTEPSESPTGFITAGSTSLAAGVVVLLLLGLYVFRVR